MNIFEMVETFNKEVIGINRVGYTKISEEEFDWLIGVFEEEAHECYDAYNEDDLIGQVDALMDLIYFAAGGLTRMGISAEASTDIFKAVHAKNMLKIKGTKARAVTHDLDAVKPEEWQPPEGSIAAILTKYKRGPHET